MSDISQPFTDMASRIELNADQGFGGAFVIVPPGEEIEAHVMLMLDNAQDPAVFWATLQTRAQIALQELQKKEDAASAGFGMGRR